MEPVVVLRVENVMRKLEVFPIVVDRVLSPAKVVLERIPRDVLTELTDSCRIEKLLQVSVEKEDRPALRSVPTELIPTRRVLVSNPANVEYVEILDPKSSISLPTTVEKLESPVCRVEVLLPRDVERLDKPICTIEVLPPIVVDTVERPNCRVDVLDPSKVERLEAVVESPKRISEKLLDVNVLKEESACCVIEKLLPEIVDDVLQTVLSPRSTSSILYPTAEDKLDTVSQMSVENVDPHIVDRYTTEILVLEFA